MNVNNLLELKATGSIAFGTVCELLGYYTPGDGGGGSFYWDAAAIDTSNDITIVKAQPATGRWKRKHQQVIDVRWAGARGNDVTNDLSALQTAIDFCAAENYTLHLSPGTYLCNGNLWLVSRLRITGEGEKSVLRMAADGVIRSEKGGIRGFGFNDNYSTEIIPANAGDYANVTFTSAVTKGTATVPVNNTAAVAAGDLVYTFNGVSNAWEQLDKNSPPAVWNDYENPLAQMEIFTVLSKTVNNVTLDRPLLFNYPKDVPLRKMVGIQDVELKDFKIIFSAEGDIGILLEQAVNSRIDNITIRNGGITLMNRCAWNTVTNCNIHTTISRCISVDAFSTGNQIRGNICSYVGGKGDAAILVMMSNNNIVSSNTVDGYGTAPSDQLGICCHARSYSNVFTGNTVRNMAEAYGLYFGGWDNIFNANTSTQCLVDYMAHYSGKALITGGVNFGSSQLREGQGRDKRAVTLFVARDVTISGCVLEKNILIQSASNVIISDNRLNSDIIVVEAGLNGHPLMIRNNTLLSEGRCISITRTSYNAAPPYTPIIIAGNYLEGKSDKLIYIERSVHVYVRNNTIVGNNKIGIGFNDIASFTEVTHNHFRNCSIAVDFSAFANNASTSYANVQGNVFAACGAPYQSWTSPENNLFSKSGGIAGFEIYNLAATPAITPDKKWVYVATADGQTGAASWQQILLR